VGDEGGDRYRCGQLRVDATTSTSRLWRHPSTMSTHPQSSVSMVTLFHQNNHVANPPTNQPTSVVSANSTPMDLQAYNHTPIPVFVCSSLLDQEEPYKALATTLQNVSQQKSSQVIESQKMKMVLSLPNRTCNSKTNRRPADLLTQVCAHACVAAGVCACAGGSPCCG
jgi:hypothetical protein